MAPYTVAHMKLGMELKRTGYDFASDERLNIFLTNTLEAAEYRAADLFGAKIADEANAASRVKRDVPVMVILGNPPYSGESENPNVRTVETPRGRKRTEQTWIGRLMEDYKRLDGKSLGEKNPKWLNDDYVKFTRFAQWRIANTGYGVLGFVTNHGYLKNPTFRAMRKRLLDTFDSICILDLHGDTHKRETAPDRPKDENVFDIKKGVAIQISVKRQTGSHEQVVRHADLFGDRASKYHWLAHAEIDTTAWEQTAPVSPAYVFVPQDAALRSEYLDMPSVASVFLATSVGIVTARDSLTVRWTPDDVRATVRDFVATSPSEARLRYSLGQDTRDWQVALAQADIRRSGPAASQVQPIAYRPFDRRFTYYTGKSRGYLCMPRSDVMRHLIAGANLCLVSARSNKSSEMDHFYCTRLIVEAKCGERTTQSCVFPLYTYPSAAGEVQAMSSVADDSWGFGEGGRRPNVSRSFVTKFAESLGLSFVTDERGNLLDSFGPADLFSYIYSLFHSPTYRTRYQEQLQVDFPRVPLTSNVELFRTLVRLGDELVGLHLLERVPQPKAAFPVQGDNVVMKVRYEAPKSGGEGGRVWINKEQFFAGVPPQVWEFHVGGYQVADKWLRTARGARSRTTISSITAGPWPPSAKPSASCARSTRRSPSGQSSRRVARTPAASRAPCGAPR